MEHPTALTTLFDLTAKLTVSNQSIFEKVTECLDHKLVDYFRKLYEDGDHMIGGFEKTKSLCTIRIYDVEGCKNITINLSIFNLSINLTLLLQKSAKFSFILKTISMNGN